MQHRLAGQGTGGPLELRTRMAERSPNGKLQIEYTRSCVDPGWSSEDLKELRDNFLTSEYQVAGQDVDIV